MNRLAHAAQNQCGLNLNKPVLIGVSGGADSLAMMVALGALGYSLVIAHIDHALRSESYEEALFVKQSAESLGWPFYSTRVDVGEAARVQHQSLEEAARQVRYQYLFEQARLHDCQAVAVAHHADDQVETVLMHFLRGAALPGLTGMSYKRIMPQWDPVIPLVRPLLGIWRTEIEAFIDEIGLKPCNDQTNFDTTFFRNRLRHELIPELETYNPQIRSVIWRMADILQEDADWLEDMTLFAFEACLTEQGDNQISLEQSAYLDLSTALRRRVLRLAIEQLRPDVRDIGYEVIARGVNFAEQAASSTEIDLMAKLRLVVVQDLLVIKTWDTDLPDFGEPVLSQMGYEAELGLDQPVNLQGGWCLEVALETDLSENPLMLLPAVQPDEAWLDYDRLVLPLLVRGPMEGERMKPLGMQGRSQSLQDLFVNLKIPAHLRPRWPLVIAAGKVAWVVGLRPGEDFKITENTKCILKLKLTKCSI